MSQPAAVLAALMLVGVAAGGILAPLRRSQRLPPLEPLPHPLEDRRLFLLRSLRDLEEARESGALQEDDYRRLHADTEARLARVLRALDVVHGPAASGKGTGGGTSPHRVRWWAAAVAAAALAGVAVPRLVAAVSDRPAGSVFTGDLAGAGPTGGLEFFEARVRRNPRDVAARLDLAHRYLDAGGAGESVEHYLAALELDPDNAEAHAHMGYLLYLNGRPESALAALDRALGTDPRYPEALLFKGMILLKGLNRPAPALEALRTYLEVAPPGPEREQVARLAQEAEASAGSR